MPSLMPSLMQSLMPSSLPTIQDRDQRFAGLTVSVHQPIKATAELDSARKADSAGKR
jgi:hypothetical protein